MKNGLGLIRISRRGLQVSLGLIWLLDAILQYQPYMFSDSFANKVIAPAALGNPGWVARPVTWAATLTGQHVTLANAAFATAQLAIAIGILWGRTTPVALAVSVPWALSVWWLGEGLGRVLTSSSSAVAGAPGAVVLYALLAVLLWPAADRPGGALAYASPAGRAASSAAWLALWGSLAYDSLLQANRTASGLASLEAGLGDGEPGWIAAIDRGASRELAGHGAAAAVLLAAVLAVVAGAVLIPAIARPALVVAMALALLIWVVGQDFGGILTGSGTDPNTGPLLVLLALAYWPRRAAWPRHARAGVLRQRYPVGSLSLWDS